MEIKTINEIQEEIISEFELFDDWMDKYEYIIQIGKEMPPLDEKFKTKENLVKGCQSQVWLHALAKEGKLFFQADGDAIITKGLVALIIRSLSNHTPNEILNANIYFIDKIGLKTHLSPTRSNGLTAMIAQVIIHALAHKTQLQK